MTRGDLKDLEALQARVDSLVTLGGREKVAQMLGRFAHTLDELLETPIDQAWPHDDVHRVTGLCGILGFAHLDRCLRAVDADPSSVVARTDARRAAEDAAGYARSWR